MITIMSVLPLQPHDPRRGCHGGRHRDARRGRPPISHNEPAGLRVGLLSYGRGGTEPNVKSHASAQN